jgi:hypothetical protein
MAEVQGDRRFGAARTARRPWVIAAGIVGATAAVTAGVLFANSLAAPAPEPSAEAIPTRDPRPAVTPSPSPERTPDTAQQVLQGAATSAEIFSPPALGPGQYLRRDWTSEELILYDEEYHAASPGWGASRTTALSGWLMRASGVQYIPGDLSAQWYAEAKPSEIIARFGDQQQAQDEGNLFLQRYGAGAPLAPFSINVPWSDGADTEDLESFFAAMPRDPAQMIAWIREHQGTDPLQGWSEGRIGWLLIELLGYNAGPPEVRAAMYRALSLLPGSEVGAEHGGRRTVAFTANLEAQGDAAGYFDRFTITIEMATGLVVETTRTADDGMGVVPSSVPDIRTTYSSMVVDSLD